MCGPHWKANDKIGNGAAPSQKPGNYGFLLKWTSFLITKMDINHTHKNRVKISNLIVAWESKVIWEQEFNAKEYLAHSWSIRLGRCSPITFYVRSLLLLCGKLVNKATNWKRWLNFGFVLTNLFMSPSHFLFKPLIPHSTCTQYPTCIFLCVCMASKFELGATSCLSILVIINISSLV
jgi:hypothetical protein